MCDECAESQPAYVAYFGKAGGKLWRPPQSVASAPRCDDELVVSVSTTPFACHDVSQITEREKS
jgi:hypothetical protein